jgi:thioredoxin reductase/bacterioferritin-associated ferredoxin
VKEAEIVIIGGGPAGISAAVEAARRDVSVVVIDETRGLGGKVLKSGEGGLKIRDTDALETEIGSRLLREFEAVAHKIDLYLNTEVWNIDDQKVVELYTLGESANATKRIHAQKLIIAAGAQERSIPFPGWTLPGVFTVGGLNTLVKRGVLPGKRFLVAGSGPLLLVLARNLIHAGAHLSAVVEAVSLKELAVRSYQMASSAGWVRWRQAIAYLARLLANKVPVYRSHVVMRALGRDEVAKAVIAQVDKDWRPIEGTQKEIQVDTVAVGYGLAPAIELTRLCGCRHHWNDRLGYWQAERSTHMETTVPGVFVAGDSSQIKGYEAAIDEGRTAGIAACAQLGKLSFDQADQLIRSLRNKLKRATRFAEALDAISAPRPGILDSIPDDTIICRCEDVTVGNIRTAVGYGARGINDIKRRTRLGMGHCQGRLCGQMINELLWKLTGESLPREVFTPRIPAKPVPFSALLE